MTRISEIPGHWFGLCRKAPVFHALQTGIGIPPESAYAGQPGWREQRTGSDPPGNRSSTFRYENPESRTGNFSGSRSFPGWCWQETSSPRGHWSYIAWSMAPYISETEWIVLNSIIEFATLFFLVLLFAGLVLSIASIKEGHALFFEGLTKAKKHLKAIVVWSVVLALAGMLIFSMYFYSPDWFPRNHLLPHILGTLFGSILNPLMEFPFNPALTPYTFFDPLRVGGIPLTSWLYPFGISQTLVFSEVNLLLFILTPFVVPFIVLEQTSPQGGRHGIVYPDEKELG